MKNDPKVKTVISQIKKIAARHGIAMTRRAVRKWDKAQADRTRLLKEKARLEKDLADVSRRIGS